MVRIEHLGDQTRLHLSLEGFDIVTLTNSETKLAAGDKSKYNLTMHFILMLMGTELNKEESHEPIY